MGFRLVSWRNRLCDMMMMMMNDDDMMNVYNV